MLPATYYIREPGNSIEFTYQLGWHTFHLFAPFLLHAMVKKEKRLLERVALSQKTDPIGSMSYVYPVYKSTKLGGGFKYCFIFTPIWGIISI